MDSGKRESGIKRPDEKLIRTFTAIFTPIICQPKRGNSHAVLNQKNHNKAKAYRDCGPENIMRNQVDLEYKNKDQRQRNEFQKERKNLLTDFFS